MNIILFLTDEISTGREGAAHDPGRPEGNDLDLVARPRIPDNQFSVERSSHTMSTMHFNLFSFWKIFQFLSPAIPCEVAGGHLVDVTFQHLFGG